MRYALADVMIYVSHNRRAHHNVGTCLWHVSLQSAMFQHITQHAKGESTEKVLFFKDQNEKCLRFITFLSTNRLNKAMIGRKRRVKRLFLRY